MLERLEGKLVADELAKVTVIETIPALGYSAERVAYFRNEDDGTVVVETDPDGRARMGRNPATGEAIKIPAKKTVKFRVAKAMKDAIVPPKKK